MTEHTSRLAVVLLNLDGGDLLLRAVDSVRSQVGVACELLVVDNGSTDDSLARLHEAHPHVAVLALGENTGYASGMNAGLARVGADVVVPMNQDAVLAPDFAARALQVLDRDPAVGVVAPLVVRVGPGPVDWNALSFELDAGPQWLARDLRLATGPTDAPRACFKANGACPVLQRRALDQVVATFGTGPFDPVYDTYGEDVDLAFRLDRLGWRTWYDPTVLAAHTTSSSSGVAIADKRGRLRTNLVAARHRTTWRHLPWTTVVVTWMAVLAGDLAFVLRQVARGDARVVPDVVRAWARVVGEVPALVAHRRTHPPRRPTWPPRGWASRRPTSVQVDRGVTGAR